MIITWREKVEIINNNYIVQHSEEIIDTALKTKTKRQIQGVSERRAQKFHTEDVSLYRSE